MKIIGKTATGYLLDLTRDELANIWGYNTYNDAPSSIFNYEVGTEIKVGEAWNGLKYLAVNKEMLAATADKLRDMANHLEVINPVVSEALKAQPTLQPTTRAVRLQD